MEFWIEIGNGKVPSLGPLACGSKRVNIVVATSTSCYIPERCLVWNRGNYFDLDDFADFLATTTPVDQPLRRKKCRTYDSFEGNFYY